jgi:hypothetical protein
MGSGASVYTPIELDNDTASLSTDESVADNEVADNEVADNEVADNESMDTANLADDISNDSDNEYFL